MLVNFDKNLERKFPNLTVGENVRNVRLSIGKVPSIFLIKFMFGLRRQDGFMIILRRGEMGENVARNVHMGKGGGGGVLQSF